jgi:hypothetical protein
MKRPLFLRFREVGFSIVLLFFGNVVSKAAQPGGYITMEPQDAFVVLGNSFRLIAEFRPSGAIAGIGFVGRYEWLFQPATGGIQTTVKSGSWRAGGAFELFIPNATQSHAGKYRIAFENSARDSARVESRWATVTVVGGGPTVTPPLIPPIPPSITRQPESQTAIAGAGVIFSVTATGTEPLSYQWRKDGMNISGANSASYAIGNVQTSHTGSYWVIVSNAGGSTSSSIAMLTVTTDGTGPGAYSFTTLAGLAGSSGNTDGIGSAARFANPFGVAVDNTGDIYVSDGGNNSIRKITSGGAVSTLEGNAAGFVNPRGLATDNAGNVYVADWGNHTIRKIMPSGAVSTLAGLTGSRGSADGTGNAARFSNPFGVAVDSAGNIYVGDGGNQTIRKITSKGVVSTLAGLAGSRGSANGTGSAARFADPWGVAVDNTGNVYVADYSNHTIRKITPSGVVSTLAGLAGNAGSADGMGSAARFFFPLGVAVDKAESVYVGDINNSTIRKIAPNGMVSTLAGLTGSRGSADGTGSAARFANPWGVAVDNAGNVYVADGGNNTIRKGVLSKRGGDTLRFSGITKMSNGSYRISLEGTMGKSVTLYASTNLINWLPLVSLPNAPETLQFDDPLAPTFIRRFYRAVAE